MSEVQGDNPNFFFQRCTFSWVLENPTLAFTSIKHVQNPIFWALDFKTSKGFFRHRPAKHRLPTQVLEVALCISWWWTKQEVGRTTKQERSERWWAGEGYRSSRWWAGEGYRSYAHIMSIIYNIVLYAWEINHLSHLHVSYIMTDFHIVSKWTFGTALAQSHRQPKKTNCRERHREGQDPIHPTHVVADATRVATWVECSASFQFCWWKQPFFRWLSGKRTQWTPIVGGNFAQFQDVFHASWSFRFCSAWHRISLKIVPIPP